MNKIIKFLMPVSICLVVVLLGYGIARAHERRMVGKYQFVVGFIVEPAFEGQKNGVDLRVSIPAEQEGGEATPIEGLESTLQVEVTHVSSGVTKVMPLRTIFRDPGHYTNDWIPTAPGQYRFRIFGKVEDLDVDEVFESGEGTFGDMRSNEGIYFPEELPETRELESAVRGAQAAADNALDAVSTVEAAAASTNTMSTIGIVLGILGTLTGAVGVFMASRRK